ncbi:hypothetical protein C0V72_15260 [Porphyrobacter sp. TH134]|uniref:PAS domain-containing protein n=1 Tax=Porphyrobacter sp. TH134 TaxID=2067450 RepID=UPI000C7B6046|nr:hypothetical protein [Porphyrobacter sp. TH134]PLK22365.1 hypothetical protein C0V72_15260 [Porphyrobacter sp. TH134]
MDTLRGHFDSDASAERSWDASEDDSSESTYRQLPPDAIGQDERRMQVRAYNHWAGLLGERMFPQIEDLDPANLTDFGPHSVLLDFSFGIDNPAVRFLGDKLAHECGAQGVITRLSDVPPRSLLSRITDHYMQILANQAPIGFEAEFVNHAGTAILYRGILLPYSSNGETIDFIYGVINWKEMADQLTADELLLEIDQALELETEMELAQDPAPRQADPVTDWADSPAHESDEVASSEGSYNDFAADFAAPRGSDPVLPDFSQYGLGDDDEDYDEDEGEHEGANAGYNFASLADYIEAPIKKAIDLSGLEPAPYDDDVAGPDYDFAPLADFGEPMPLPEPLQLSEPLPMPEPFPAEQAEAPELSAGLPADAGLYDCLAAARELARAADSTEDRSRSALYAAVSRAYDFSLAAQANPDDYAELIADSGLTVQDRAPMTPVVKLVFGHDYDKTRLTEYAAVLTHAHRLKLAPGSLDAFLAEVDGGVKAVVKAERRLRREEQGKPVESADAVREALAQQLRGLEAITLEELDGAGPEFALVLIRRDEIGCAEILAEIPEDIAQIERAARKLAG